MRYSCAVWRESSLLKLGEIVPGSKSSRLLNAFPVDGKFRVHTHVGDSLGSRRNPNNGRLLRGSCQSCLICIYTYDTPENLSSRRFQYADDTTTPAVHGIMPTCETEFFETLQNAETEARSVFETESITFHSANHRVLSITFDEHQVPKRSGVNLDR